MDGSDEDEEAPCTSRQAQQEGPGAPTRDTAALGAPGASSAQKPKSIHRAKSWSGEVENLYRFQQAGYRDEDEYKRVRQVEAVDRWPETGFVKKLQRRDNTFYYYDRERECEDKEVHKVKVFSY